MDLSIKKDQRNNGMNFHKIPRCSASSVRSEALKEITKEFNINYVHKEVDVLNLSKIDFIVNLNM